MPVMILSHGADLGPLPTEKSDDVWVHWVTGGTVALTYRFYAVAPLAQGETLGVISEKVKV